MGVHPRRGRLLQRGSADRRSRSGGGGATSSSVCVRFIFVKATAVESGVQERPGPTRRPRRRTSGVVDVVAPPLGAPRDDVDRRRGVRVARVRVALRHELPVRRQEVDDRVLGDARLVEAEEGDRGGVGGPLVGPPAVPARELLLVDPVEPPVQDRRRSRPSSGASPSRRRPRRTRGRSPSRRRPSRRRGRSAAAPPRPRRS